MRALALLVVAFGVITLNAHAGSVNDELDLYNTVVYGKSFDVPHCDGVLKTSLNDVKGAVTLADLSKAEAALRKERCLDDYSSLKIDEFKLPVTVDLRWNETHVYIRISAFGRFGLTTSLLDEKVAQALADSRSPLDVTTVTDVIVDFRGDPGGDVDDMGDLLEKYFSPAEDLDFMFVDATKSYPPKRTTTKMGLFAGKRITLLVDHDTVSAAEWATAILRYEWYPATSRILGEKTFGKAIIQCMKPLDDKVHYSKLTCGEWKIGTRKVHGVGLTPDGPFPVDACKYDGACIERLLAKR